MSMLSSQVDELRELATRYDELQVGAVRAVTMPPNMGSILREAADTIWQLRDDLQRANDAVRDAEHDESRAWDRVRKAECDNAKLRELVRHMRTCMEHYEMDGTISCDRCPLDNCVGNCDFERRMRELGVDE